MATENPLQRDLCAGTWEDGLVCNEMVVMAKEIYTVHFIFLFFLNANLPDQFPNYLRFYLLFSISFSFGILLKGHPFIFQSFY